MLLTLCCCAALVTPAAALPCTLTDADYQLLREKYEARALEALAQLDRLSQAQRGTGAGRSPALS